MIKDPQKILKIPMFVVTLRPWAWLHTMQLWYWEIGLVTACSDFLQKSNTADPNFIEMRRGCMHTEHRGFWSCSSDWGSTLHGKCILQWKRLPAVLWPCVCWVQISEPWKIIQVWIEQPLLSSRRWTWMEEDLLRAGLSNLVSATVWHHQTLGWARDPCAGEPNLASCRRPLLCIYTWQAVSMVWGGLGFPQTQVLFLLNCM